MAMTSAYPVQLELEAPLEVARWRPLVHWLLGIPHLIVVQILGYVQCVLVVIAWFAILFTGNIPKGLFDFMAMILRYQWRTNSYVYFMREPYPPFAFDAQNLDPGDDPARFSIEYPERLSRGLIFIKWLLIIPHAIALFILFIGAFFVGIASFFAVLFTGRWPEGMRNFIIGVTRWGTRVAAYFLLMTDVYPPFSLEP
jgi:Domain of unknown function (DUF4389)